jgi:hypothetical protein
MSLSDLQKKLEKESQGIMFPFSASASTVNTTQNVYDSATDGIMTMQGKKYVGPNSVVQYTPVGQRQLKEIEKGMLPQFDQEQFPDVGQGRVEDRGGTLPFDPTTLPTYQTQTPAVDPCPAGYQLINGVCQPIQKSSGGGRNQTSTFNIKDYTPVLSRSQGSMNAGAINSAAMLKLEEDYGAEATSAIGLTNQKYNNRGAMIKIAKDEEGNVIKNPDDTIKIERIIPNPANNVGEVINDVFTAIGDVTKLALDNSLIGKIANGLGYTKEQASNVYKLSPEQQKELIDYQEKTKLESSSKPESSSFDNITSEEFGSIDNLTKDINDFKMQIDAINEMLPPGLQQKFKNQSGVKDTLDKKKQLEFKLKNKERELKKAKQKAKEVSQGFKVKDTSKEARQFEERFSKQKSKQKLKEERDQTLKFFDDNVKGIKKETTKSTTKTTPSKSSSSSSPFKRPSFTKNPSGGYTRKYTGR